MREINSTAKRIAQGDFDARIQKKHNDEIGELCDTINEMAVELGTLSK
ncbi:MAG: HAMP domain-containing protein [Eubacteriales bacterium]